MVTRLFEAEATDVLYIIDISGYVFRAFHAIAPLSSPSGEPTNAVLGTVNMVERLIKQCRPKMLAIAMDSRTKTFRKELYSEYKANRPPPPAELKQQMARVGELVEALDVPVFQCDGVEADDVIATAVRQCRALALRVVVVSADKDLMQLVGEDVVLWDTMRDRVFGVAEVYERYGVQPSQMRDLLALMGDSSDNVPGVPSVGPKTAKDLLVEFGDLDGIYANLDKLKRKKLREALSEHEAQARLSQQLVTLREEVDITLSPEQLRFKRIQSDKLRALYAELGFQRQLAALDALDPAEHTGLPTAAAPTALPTVEMITTLAQLQALEPDLRAAGRTVVLPSLLGTTALSSALIGLAIATSKEKAYYIPLGHRYVGCPQQLPEAEVLSWLAQILALPGMSLGGHDVKSLMVVLTHRNLDVPSVAFDSLLSSFLLDAGDPAKLERIAQRELGWSIATLDDITKVAKRRGRLALDEVEVAAMAQFLGLRSAVVAGVWDTHLERMDDEGLRTIWADIEQPLIPMLAEMEMRGICLDTDALAELGKTVALDLARLEKKAHELAGKEFNVNSPRQLETLLFDELNLKPIKRTKTSRSTDAATLEALSSQHPLPEVILEFRQLSKLQSNYIDTLPGLVNASTGRLHTIWHQEGAATGRLSSSEPNLQNIPIRTELGSRIRAAFIAQPGHVLVSADYSQIELRVLAHLSEDPVLVDAFTTGQDIHVRTAMEIFEVDEDEVDKDLRRQAKAVNFGVIYGQGDSALGKSLGIPRMEAGQFIAAYFRRYAGVRRFMDATLESARAGGTVRTLLGRRRAIPDINNGNRARRLAAERVAMNTPIQGTAADLIKLAMLRLRAPVTPGTAMLLTVHDELVFEVPEQEADQASLKIREAMENVFPLRVPLCVDVGKGHDWRSAH